MAIINDGVVIAKTARMCTNRFSFSVSSRLWWAMKEWGSRNKALKLSVASKLSPVKQEAKNKTGDWRMSRIPFLMMTSAKPKGSLS